MIVFDLECRSGGHKFEGWFGSSDDFARQQERGLVACPQCGGADVTKAPMAPNLARKGNQRGDSGAVPMPAVPQPAMPASATSAPASGPNAGSTQAVPVSPAPPSVPMPPQLQAALFKVAQMQAAALKRSRWVGGKFADDARAMHYGDMEPQLIHGQSTPDEARALIEEGIEVAPVLFPIAPPDEVN